ASVASYVQFSIEIPSVLSGFEDGLEAQVVETYKLYDGAGLQPVEHKPKLKMNCSFGEGYCLGGFGPRRYLRLAHESYHDLKHTVRIKNLKDGSYLKFENG